ncbi:hypothetical protein BH18ACI3_BH18ACI3_14530 [soil metagenome]
MKRCPRCGQTYSDAAINFCLEDGELLAYLADDAPRPLPGERPQGFMDDSPTVVLNKPRDTNQMDREVHSPPAPWQNQSPVYGDQQVGMNMYDQTRNQTLPYIALSLGLASVVLVCCQGGIWLGLPAVVIGVLGMRNAEKDPNQYTGRGMAVAGMVLGIVTFLASLIFLIFGLVAR